MSAPSHEDKRRRCSTSPVTKDAETKKAIANLTPHSIVVYDDEGKNVLCTIPPPSDKANIMRSGTKPSHKIDSIVLGGVSVDIYPPARFTDTNDVDPLLLEGDIIVAWIAGDQFAKENPDFKHRILVPDTGPDSVVRSDKGTIIGVRRFSQLNA